MQRTALIIGATGGIGMALANALDTDPSYNTVLRSGRHSDIRMDFHDESSIAHAAEQIAGAGASLDLIIVATGILHRNAKGPEKALRELDPDWMMENYLINAIGPALVAKYFLPVMARNQPVCFAALSARVGSISDNNLGGWHSYRASKAALNMLIKNIAIEWQRKNAQSVVVGLHPGTVETPLSGPFKGNPAHERFTPDKAAAQLLDVLRTLGPEHSGGLFAYDGQAIAA
jgi:NAD(P)-dependent dehydrogenase (short-subunit alcohol dehydrogenase family)